MRRSAQNDYSLLQYYRDKYGKEAIEKLEKDAEFCYKENDLPRRNRLLRVRDELTLDDQASSQ